MEEINQTPVNAGQEGVTDSQVTDTSVQDTSVQNSDVADPKPVQDTQTNAAFAQMRREMESYKRDLDISRKYGTEYGVHSEQDIVAKFGQSHGINNLQQFEQALQNQQYKQNGLDPDLLNQFLSNHPDIQAAREMKRDSERMAQDVRLSNDPNYGTFYQQFKPEVQSLADRFNVDYETAFTMVLKEQFPNIVKGLQTKGEQSAIQKLTQNAQTSTGSLNSGDVQHNTSISKMPKADFDKLVDSVLRGETKNL